MIEILKNYRFFATFRYLSKSDNQSENRMPLKLSRKATVSIASNARFVLGKKAHFVFGANSGAGFLRPSYLSMGSGSTISVDNNFSIADNAYCIILFYLYYIINYLHLNYNLINSKLFVLKL